MAVKLDLWRTITNVHWRQGTTTNGTTASTGGPVTTEPGPRLVYYQVCFSGTIQTDGSTLCADGAWGSDPGGEGFLLPHPDPCFPGVDHDISVISPVAGSPVSNGVEGYYAAYLLPDDPDPIFLAEGTNIIPSGAPCELRAYTPPVTP